MHAPALPLGLELFYSENMAPPSTLVTVSRALLDRSTHGLRKQLSREQWEGLKSIIQNLYIEENKTFLEIADILGKDHNFRPTFDPC
jgi:uncharacterized alpha-E superfamily protein